MRFASATNLALIVIKDLLDIYKNSACKVELKKTYFITLPSLAGTISYRGKMELTEKDETHIFIIMKNTSQN